MNRERERELDQALNQIWDIVNYYGLSQEEIELLAKNIESGASYYAKENNEEVK